MLFHDEKYRCSNLSAAIREYRKADYLQVREVFQKIMPTGYTVEQQEINALHERCLDSLLSAAHQWCKSIKHSDSEAVRQFEDKALSRKIRHIRNLKEHWEQNRDFFSNSLLEIPGEDKYNSARWYRRQYPNKTPWSSGWSNLEGTKIGGAINLEELETKLSEFYVLLERMARLGISSV